MLKFDEHILVKLKNPNAIAGLIRRTFLYLDIPLFKILFTTLVSPHLEYGQVIGTPHLKKIYNYSGKCATLSDKICGWFSSHELLRKAEKLNLPPLVYRRACGDMIEIFRHFHSYNNCSLPENIRPQNRPSRKHDYQLVWKAPKDGVSGKFFLLPNNQNLE